LANWQPTHFWFVEAKIAICNFFLNSWPLFWLRDALPSEVDAKSWIGQKLFRGEPLMKKHICSLLAVGLSLSLTAVAKAQMPLSNPMNPPKNLQMPQPKPQQLMPQPKPQQSTPQPKPAPKPQTKPAPMPSAQPKPQPPIQQSVTKYPLPAPGTTITKKSDRQPTPGTTITKKSDRQPTPGTTITKKSDRQPTPDTASTANKGDSGLTAGPKLRTPGPAPAAGAPGRGPVGIVGEMPQIDKWREHEWHHYWHPWHHWRHDWDWAHRFWGPDFGTGNTFTFQNTYSPTIENSGNTNQQFDYSKPLPRPSAEERAAAEPPAKKKDGAGSANDDTAQKKDDALAAVNQRFDAARESFKGGDYDKALEQVNAAIEKRPSDATFHEFKALCLFAQGKFKEAAPVLYAVIAAGPGWDSDTMNNFYPDEDTYQKQFKALKDFVVQESDAGYGHFVLAYHYLAQGRKSLAVKELKEVTRTQPEDKLSAELLKVLA
jgi:hypothetical protein